MTTVDATQSLRTHIIVMPTLHFGENSNYVKEAVLQHKTCEECAKVAVSQGATKQSNRLEATALQKYAWRCKAAKGASDLTLYKLC
jgi:hypothetical protein